MVRGHGNKFHAGNRVEPQEVDPITQATEKDLRAYSRKCGAEPMCTALLDDSSPMLGIVALRKS